MQGGIRDVSLKRGSGRSPGGGHGNPLQYSCLENPMERGAWQAAVHGVTKSQTQLRKLSTQAGRKEHRTKTFSKKSSNLLLKLYLFESEVILITLISLLTNQISYQMISKAILILNLTLCHHRTWATPHASSHHSSPC